MAAIIRSVVLLSAVVAAALFVAFETSGPRAENPPATAPVVQRFPLTSEMFAPVPITTYVAQKFIAAQKVIEAQKVIAPQKAHRTPMSEFCASTPNGWPYVSRECLVAADGTRVPGAMPS
jgi:hypothetical protein